MKNHRQGDHSPPYSTSDTGEHHCACRCHKHSVRLAESASNAVSPNSWSLRGFFIVSWQLGSGDK
jgi:hypothetical protein